MNPNVLRRFITYMIVAMLALGLLSIGLAYFQALEPGDYEVKQGSQRLDDGLYDEALALFNQALEKSPDHRGALMGRALVFIARQEHQAAVNELNYLIDYLETNLDPDDGTGRATLAAAYANRGIINDRERRYEEALADYVAAIRTDEGAVDGPGWIDRLLYGNPNPSTVRDRARYIYEQLKLPEEQRVLSVPALDAEQRSYKPR